MEATQRDKILKSEAGNRMADNVTPIYDNSYVACWIYEIIGGEFDKLWDALESLPNQLFPETATWSLELWERRYHLPVGVGTIQERRNNVMLKRGNNLPLCPARLENVLSLICGCTVKVVDYIAPFTFGVIIESSPSQEITKMVKQEIDRQKPSHLSCQISYESSAQSKAMNVGYISYGRSLHEIRQAI